MGTWTPEKDDLLRDMFVRQGLSRRAIAKALGLHQWSISARVKRLGIDAQQGAKGGAMSTALLPPGAHLRDYRRARRGFDVPPDLEGAYHDLLKRGLSIEDARRKLGLKRHGDGATGGDQAAQ